MEMANNKIKMAGRFFANVYRDGKLLYKDEIGSPNVVVDEGRNHMLATEFAGGGVVPTWYIGIYTGTFSPDVSLTAAAITATATESEAYTESDRVEWIEVADTGNVKIDNSASPAVFNINGNVTIRGAFLVSVNTKSSQSGTLMACANFGTARALVNLDQLVVTYEIASTSV